MLLVHHLAAMKNRVDSTLFEPSEVRGRIGELEERIVALGRLL